MRFISSDFNYRPIDLAKFADAHRTEICGMCDGRPVRERLNGRAVAHCALCKGKGRERIALIECDDCKRLVLCDEARPVYVGPGEDRGDALYRPLCVPCDDLDTAQLNAVEREEISEIRGW